MHNVEKKIKQNMSETCEVKPKLLFTLLRPLIILCLMAGILILSSCGKEYTMLEVNINAEISSDGTLHVVEERVFDFKDDFSTVWWEFKNIRKYQEVTINGATLQKLDSDGNPLGEKVVLDEVTFERSWREKGGPGIDAFSYDSAWDSVYMFFDVSNERIKITVDYSLTNAVTVYSDIADFSWEFVGSNWAVDSDNVSMSLTLPVKPGDSVIGEENVFVWGHGPLEGEVNINPDGTISYIVPSVTSGQFAEARVLFPETWIEGIDESAVYAYEKFDEIYQEEAKLANEANLQRILSVVFYIAVILLSVGMLIWGIVDFRKKKEGYRVDFSEQYWRDVPSPIDHPVVISRLWNYNKIQPEDITVAILNLVQKGALKIRKDSHLDSQGNTVEDYLIEKIPVVADTLTDPIDLSLIDILFTKISEDDSSFWLTSIEQYSEANPKAFIKDIEKWQRTISKKVTKRHFFEEENEDKKFTPINVTFFYGILTGAACWGLEQYLLLFIVVLVSGVLIKLDLSTKELSSEAGTITAKCEALKNWLTDFSSLDERPPSDIKVWGNFMIYAYIFGIAKQVMKELQLKLPQMFDGIEDEDGSLWVALSASSIGGLESAALSAGEILNTSLTSSYISAEAAISHASGKGSSSFGGGGGFSSGGGGSFSSGGGAR